MAYAGRSQPLLLDSLTCCAASLQHRTAQVKTVTPNVLKLDLPSPYSNYAVKLVPVHMLHFSERRSFPVALTFLGIPRLASFIPGICVMLSSVLLARGSAYGPFGREQVLSAAEQLAREQTFSSAAQLVS